MKQADQAVIRTQRDPQKEAFEAAQKRYQSAQDNLKKLTSDEHEYSRLYYKLIDMGQLSEKHMGSLRNLGDLGHAVLDEHGNYLKTQYSEAFRAYERAIDTIINTKNVSTKTKLDAIRKLQERYGIDPDAEQVYTGRAKEIYDKMQRALQRGQNGLADMYKQQLENITKNDLMYAVNERIKELQKQYEAEVKAAKAEADNAAAAYKRAQKIWQEEQALRARLEAERKAQEAYENALIDVTGLIEKYDDLVAAIGKARWSADYLRRTYVKLNTALSAVSTAVAYAKTRFHALDGTSASVLKDVSLIEEGFFRLASSLDAANDEAGNLIDNLGARLEEYRKTLYDTIKGQTNLFDEFKKYSGEEPTSANKYLNNMASQIEGLETWLDNLEALAARGVSGDILQVFASEGISSFEKVAAFVKATDEQLGDLIYQYRKYMDLMEGTNGVTAAADRALALIASSYSDKALSLADQLVSKFKDAGMERVKDVAENTAVMIIEGIKDGLTRAMPSIQNAVNSTTTTTTMAERIGESVASGINNGLIQAVSNSVDTTVKAAVEKFKMAVDEINQYVQENLQTEYTITIHVDTSEIDAAIARFNGAISAVNVGAGVTAQAVQVSMDNNAAPVAPTTVQTPATAPVNVTYTQNNYSPKALSRTEIYRQTQNQLSTIEGAISSAISG